MIDLKQLVGTWFLISCEFRSQEGEVARPLGAAPLGLLIYGPDGHMAVAMMRNERTACRAPQPFLALAEEKIEAFDSYVSYAGRYRVEGDIVVHQVQVASFPNWSNTSLVRHVTFEADRLVLRTSSDQIEGKSWTATLHWRRSHRSPG